MQFNFFKYFLSWVIFYSLIIFFSFFQVGAPDVTINLIVAFILGVPLAVISTYLFKWVIEIRLKNNLRGNVSITETQEVNIEQLSNRTAKSIIKSLIILFLSVLGLIFYTIPIEILLIYWTIAALAKTISKRMSFLLPWYVWVFGHGLLLYGLFWLIYSPLYSITFGFYWAWAIVNKSAIFLSMPYFVSVLVPILLYEWYKAFHSKVPGNLSRFFVVIPFLAGILIFWLFNVNGKSNESQGYAMLEIIQAVPWMIIMPLGWIFFKERSTK